MKNKLTKGQLIKQHKIKLLKKKLEEATGKKVVLKEAPGTNFNPRREPEKFERVVNSLSDDGSIGDFSNLIYSTFENLYQESFEANDMIAAIDKICRILKNKAFDSVS